MGETVTGAPARVLVVDDDTGTREIIREALAARGYDVAEAGSCAQARSRLAERPPDVALLDYQLPDGTALDILSDFHRETPGVPVVILTGYGTVDLAVQAIQEGAAHFLTKPVALPALVTLLEGILEQQRHRRAYQARREGHVLEPFLGTSPAIRRLELEAQRMLAASAPIMLLGETGTGKGVLARWLHQRGPRAAEAMVEFHCASVTGVDLHQELFGRSPNEGTVGQGTRSGVLESADRGTLVLADVGDLDAAAQAALLRVVSEGRFRRVGEQRDRRVDARLVSTERREASTLIQDSGFRQDLFFRLGALTLELPALRDRPEDIPLLAADLLRRLATEIGQRNPNLSDGALKVLTNHDWPGNIRELRNVLERALLFSGDSQVTEAHLPSLAARRPRPLGNSLLPGTLEATQRRQIELAMVEARGRVDQAATLLGIPRSTLYQKLKRYQIPTRRQWMDAAR
jgi:DNA-binding NtrC family response regulator